MTHPLKITILEHASRGLSAIAELHVHDMCGLVKVLSGKDPEGRICIYNL